MKSQAAAGARPVPAAEPRPSPDSARPSAQTVAAWDRAERAAPWFVFGLAAAFRLGSIDLASLQYDEADAILRARAAAQGQWPLAGAMHSWGFADPPLQVYFMAPFAWLPSPVVASVAAIALLNALTVLGTYLLAARFFGSRLALVAGVLYAVNPWAIYFGRRAWIQAQPALALLAMWAAFEVVLARRAGFGLPFFLALAAGVQARLLAATYAPAALVSLALGGRVWLSRWSILGVLGGVAITLPYVAYLVLNREQIAAALAAGNRVVSAAPNQHGVFEFTWWVASGFNLLPTPSGLAGWLDLLGRALEAQSLLVALLLVASAMLCLAPCIRRRPGWQRYPLVLAWTVLPLGLLASQSSTVYLHYLVLLFPPIFLLVAMPIAALLARRPPLAWLGVAAFLAVAAPQAASWLALQRVLAIYDPDERVEATLTDRRLLAELMRESGQRIGTGESYGVEVPLRFWLAAADRTRAELAARPAELLVATDGTNPLAETRPALLETVLGPDLSPRYQPLDMLLLPVARPALLLVTSDVETAVAPERLGPRKALIPLPTLGRNARDGIRLFEVPARSVAEWSGTLGAATVPAGVSVVSPRRARAGESLEVLTLWPGPVETFRPSLALVGTGGQRIEEKETPERGSVTLAADRLAIVRHSLALPNRLAGGEFRLVAQPAMVEAEWIELGGLVVVAR